MSTSLNGTAPALTLLQSLWSERPARTAVMQKAGTKYGTLVTYPDGQVKQGKEYRHDPKTGEMVGDGQPLIITDAMLVTHVEGTATYACPLIGADGLARAIVLELDHGGEQLARDMLGVAADAGLTAFSIACKGASEHDGSHTWVLYQQEWNPERLQEQARQLLRVLDLPEKEVYPSGANIRLPFGLHVRTNTRGALLLQDGRRFDLDAHDELATAAAAVVALPRNTLPPPPPADAKIKTGPKKKTITAGVVLPLDDYNARCDRSEVERMLTDAGWSEAGGKGSIRYWTRPGKSARAGHSATLGYVADTVLSVFSTADSKLPGKSPEGIHYSPAAIYTHLEHDGDFEAAAKALYHLGYGTRWETIPPRFDADNRPHCPQCDKLLRRSNNGHGWRCLLPNGDLCYFWEGDAAHPNTTASGESGGAEITPSQQYIAALQRLGYHFRLNLCNNDVEVNGVPLDDIIEAEIRTQARDHNVAKDAIGALQDAYIVEAARNAYHPIKDYLNSLTWDGKDHIGQLAAYLTSTDAPIVYEDGHAEPLHAVYLRRWLIGAVAKVMQAAQNVMLVLAGSQDIGKSALARWLCSGLPQYFIESPINVADKDSDVRLISKWIWEVSELGATTRRTDVEALKAFTTKQDVTVRKSYGKRDTVKPALASFIGTVNPGAGFLVDETGNRRFMTTFITHIDWSYTELDVHQLWAQAVALYQAGESWRLKDAEVVRQKEQNKVYEIESVLDGWLTKYFDCAAGDDALMTAADIVDHLYKHDIRLPGSPTAQAMELSRVLARLDVQKVRSSRWRGYRGIRPRDNPMTTYDNLPIEVVTQNMASPRPNDNVTPSDTHVSKTSTPSVNVQSLSVNGNSGVGSVPVSANGVHFSKKEVVTGCHVVIEASQSGRANDNLPGEAVIEVVTPLPADYIGPAIWHGPNGDDFVFIVRCEGEYAVSLVREPGTVSDPLAGAVIPGQFSYHLRTEVQMIEPSSSDYAVCARLFSLPPGGSDKPPNGKATPIFDYDADKERQISEALARRNIRQADLIAGGMRSRTRREAQEQRIREAEAALDAAHAPRAA